jgi:hypothetical protein
MMTRRLALVPMLLALALSLFASADSTWQKPPKEILEVLHAPALPNAFLDPTRSSCGSATLPRQRCGESRG